MKSIRVHASVATPEGRIPYLLLSLIAGGRIAFDFRPMDTDPIKRIPTLALSFDALAELLEGKKLTVHQNGRIVTLIPLEGELIILSQANFSGPVMEYRVWLAELGLGWNMLSGPGYDA